MSDIEATIRNAKIILQVADDAHQVTPETTDSATLDALIQIAGALLTVVHDQQRQIERLERESAPLVKPQPKGVQVEGWDV